MSRVLRRVVGDRLVLSAVGVALVLVATVAYLLAVVLDQPLTSRPDRVVVAMPAAGGLFEGSAVTYRGVKVGRVTEVRVAGDGVEAVLALQPDSRVPRETRARVRSLSPVGEQYLDLQPRADEGPWLDDGDRLSATVADLPTSLARTVVALDGVLAQVDERDLRTVLRELSTGLAGTGEELGRLVDQGDLLLADLEGLLPETERLLGNADTVLDLPLDQRADLTSLGRSSRRFAAFLRDYDPELRRTLTRAPGQLARLRDLVDEVAAVLPPFLRDAGRLAGVLADHEPHLRALLTAYPRGLGSLLDQVRDGRLHIAIITQRDARCSYGTARRSPREAGARELPRDARCPGSFPTLQRGAAHAPGPVR